MRAAARPTPRTFVYLGTFGASRAEGTRGYPVLTATPPAPTCAMMLNDQFGVRGTAGPKVTPADITKFTPAFEQAKNKPDGTPAAGETHVTAQMTFICKNNNDAPFLIGRGDAIGGYDLAATSKGTKPYSNYIAEITKANQLAMQSGARLVVGAINVIQGEKDAQEGTLHDDFVTTFNRLASDVNADTRAITGQSRNVLLFIAQNACAAQNSPICQSPIQQALFDVALAPNHNSNARYCFAEYANTISPIDGLHFDTPGYDRMGDYLGKCVNQELFAGKVWLPLQPRQIIFNPKRRERIELFLSVPVPPVQLDVSRPFQGAAPNFGLSYVDDCNSQSIVGVSRISGAQIEVRLSGPPTCAYPHLRNAWTPPALLNDVDLPTVANAGSSGTPAADGTCRLTLSLDPTKAYAQATLDATLANGSIQSIDAIAGLGLYPPADGSTDGATTRSYTDVPVTGCNLAGATVNVQLRQGFASAKYPAAWSNIHDSDTTIGPTTGETLPNFLPAFDLPLPYRAPS